MQLHRPVGIHELRLIAASGWTAFPPRLPGQPIFYPVLDEGYAVQVVGGRITVGACFYGPRFTGAIDPATDLPADLAS
jgi:hypothetical protein